MSNVLKKFGYKKLFIVFLCGASLGWLTMTQISAPSPLSGLIVGKDIATKSQSLSRSLASVFIGKNTPKESGTAMLEKLPAFALAKGKHLSLLMVRLASPENIPLDNTDDVLEIHGTIQSNFNQAADLQYEWLLPDDVQIVSGSQQNSILQAIPGKTYTVSIQVRGFNKIDKKIITLKATLEKDGTLFGNTSLISSRPEDSMEYIAKDMADGEAQDLDTAPREGQIFK